MAATFTQERFAGPEWTFEQKIDGIPLLAFRRGREVVLLARLRNPQHLPAIAEAVGRLPVREVILDGEVTWGQVECRCEDRAVLELRGRRARPCRGWSLPLVARWLRVSARRYGRGTELPAGRSHPFPSAW